LDLLILEIDEAVAGDIVSVTGIPEAQIGDTIASVDNPEALPTIELKHLHLKYI
jgi:GTP-binding protein